MSEMVSQCLGRLPALAPFVGPFTAYLLAACSGVLRDLRGVVGFEWPAAAMRMWTVPVFPVHLTVMDFDCAFAILTVRARTHHHRPALRGRKAAPMLLSS
jgi:hypothetical protein